MSQATAERLLAEAASVLHSGIRTPISISWALRKAYVANRHFPTDESQSTLAAAYYRTSDFEVARTILSDLMTSSGQPPSVITLAYYGLVSRELGDLDGFEEAKRRIQQISISDSELSKEAQMITTELLGAR